MPNKFSELVKIAGHLRSDKGCPWDREQTILSMIEHFTEEAEEVKSAMEKGDHANLQEELGDLLFNIVLIAQIAKEEKLFNISKVLSGIEKKIKTRHTWVFGKDKAKTADEALVLWTRNKQKEKANAGANPKAKILT